MYFIDLVVVDFVLR